MAIEVFVLDRPAHDGAAPAARSGGRGRAALAAAMTRTAHERWGKGPTRAKVYVEDGFVLCALEEPLTTVERTLVDGGETDLVRELRLDLQELASPELAGQVEALIGRRVLASQGVIVFDPDILFEIFVLARTGAP